MKRYLLDTHVVYWWMTGSKRLTKSTANLIRKEACFVSVASIWEMQLKRALGKLALPNEPIHLQLSAEGFGVWPISAEHVERFREIGSPHSDPFDRLLIAISDFERVTFLTKDAAVLSLDLKHVQEA